MFSVLADCSNVPKFIKSSFQWARKFLSQFKKKKNRMHSCWQYRGYCLKAHSSKQELSNNLLVADGLEKNSSSSCDIYKLYSFFQNINQKFFLNISAIYTFLINSFSTYNLCLAHIVATFFPYVNFKNSEQHLLSKSRFCVRCYQ